MPGLAEIDTSREEAVLDQLEADPNFVGREAIRAEYIRILGDPNSDPPYYGPTREDKILALLDREPNQSRVDEIFEAHIQLEEAKNRLRQDYSDDRQWDCNHGLTILNWLLG